MPQQPLTSPRQPGSILQIDIKFVIVVLVNARNEPSDYAIKMFVNHFDGDIKLI